MASILYFLQKYRLESVVFEHYILQQGNIIILIGSLHYILVCFVRVAPNVFF